MKKISILLIGIIMLLPQQLSAKYQTEFIPSISITELWDDNIDLDNENEKSDWITAITPGVTLNILSQDNIFSLKYSPSIVRYKDEDQNNTVRHLASLSFSEMLLKNIRFTINDSYVKSEDPLESTEGVIGTRETRNIYQRNNLGSNINFIFGPSNSFILGFNHSWLENDDVTIDDGKIFDPYGTLSYWFNQKHGMDLNLGYTVAEFSRDDGNIPDDDYSGGRSGVAYKYRANSLTTMSLRYDYNTRNFKGLMGEEDYMVHEASLGLEKQLSTDLSYTISAGYFIQDRDYSDDGNGLIFDASLQKKLSKGSLSIDAKGGWDEIVLEADRRGFTKYQQLGSTFNYNMTKNLTNYSRISYRQDKDSANRKSKSLRFSYGFRWLFLKYYTALIDYSFAKRDEDQEDEDYNVNRVMVGIEWSRPYR
ncbi:MAG: outer membrane beta-barrel protein [Deltaproteobacteria bacterium]|nr:outer membrane beta-barrel protein [Deltaproteobacteria bacterium]